MRVKRIESVVYEEKRVKQLIHIQLYTYICGNIIKYNDEKRTSLEKYTSHTLFKRVAKGLCVRGELMTE